MTNKISKIVSVVRTTLSDPLRTKKEEVDKQWLTVRDR